MQRGREDELCSNRKRSTLLQRCGFEDTRLEKQKDFELYVKFHHGEKNIEALKRVLEIYFGINNV